MKAARSTVAIAAGVAALAAFGSGSAMAGTSHHGARCATGDLPAGVIGNPGAIRATAAGDAYIWHNGNGWHLRVRHAGSSKLVFTGTIATGDGKTIRYHRHRLERNDTVALSPDRTSLTFTMNNYGHVDGLDLKMDCSAKVTFDLKVAGTQMTTDRIHLGRARVDALASPVVIERH
jgi:hypothetical protein